MLKKHIAIGTRFGKWVALGEGSRSLGGKLRTLCRCDCGKESHVDSVALRGGRTNSCLSCSVKRGRESTSFRHGAAGSARTAEYKIWLSMRRRCDNENQRCWKDYGGRGIKCCERWDSFENFLEDMGSRPSRNHSLHRINNNGNYEPENCMWATLKQQAENKRPMPKGSELRDTLKLLVEENRRLS
jgi:hypothetical protein